MYVRPCPQGIKAQELFHQRASKSFCPRELCVTLWGRKFSPEAFTAGDCPILPCLLLLSGPDHTNSRAAGPAACLDQNPCPQRPHPCLLLTAPWVASVTNRRRLIDSPSLGRAQLFDHLGQTRGLQISSSTQNSGQNPKERDKKRKEGRRRGNKLFWIKTQKRVKPTQTSCQHNRVCDWAQEFWEEKVQYLIKGKIIPPLLSVAWGESIFLGKAHSLGWRSLGLLIYCPNSINSFVLGSL